MRSWLALGLIIVLAGCGRQFVAEQMVAPLSPADAALFSQSPLRGEIELLDVETTFNPSVAVSIWILVPAEDIQSALSDSSAGVG